MSDLETKRSTENAPKAFGTQPLEVAATGLLGSRANNQGWSHSRNAKRTCGANC